MSPKVEKRSWFGRRGSPWALGPVEDRALTVENVPPAMLSTISNGAPVITPDAAMQIADVYSCIRALSDAAATLPLIPYRKTAQGRTRDSGHLSDLLRRPAPGSTQANLIAQAVASLQTHGNCFFGKFKDTAGRVQQLALLHPDRVAPELVAGDVRYVVHDGHGRRAVHGTDDIIHVRALGTDGLVGLSPVRQCRQALGLAQSLAGHADNFARNAGRPGGILSLSNAHDFLPTRLGRGNTQTTPAEDHKLAFEDKFAGAEKAGKILVIAAGTMDYQQLALSMADAEFVAQRNLSTAEIARIFRVPPWIIGASSGDAMTYSNVEGQAQAFVKFSLAPWLTLIEQAISADTDLCPGDAFVEFLLDGLLRSDSKTRADVYTKALDPVTGWLSRSEVRKLENLEPEPPTAPTGGIA